MMKNSANTVTVMYERTPNGLAVMVDCEDENMASGIAKVVAKTYGGQAEIPQTSACKCGTPCCKKSEDELLDEWIAEYVGYDDYDDLLEWATEKAKDYYCDNLEPISYAGIMNWLLDSVEDEDSDHENVEIIGRKLRKDLNID